MPDNFLSFPTQSPYQDWGFKFTSGAIDNFIRQIEGEAVLETCLEFCDRRKYAENLMFELFSQTHYLFYLTRQGKGKELGEQILGLTIATDLDGLELPERLEKRGLTLGLIAAVNSNGYGGLKILSTRLLSKQKGKQNAFSAPFYLRLRSNFKYGIGVPLEAIERITVLPLPPAPPTEKQLKAWKAFVGVEERLAREKQFCVPFVSHNYGEATRNITFKIDAKSATVDSQAENSITLNDFWQRAKRACNQNIKLRENDSRDRDGRELGTIESIDSEKNFLKISLDSEVLDSLAEGHYSLPQEGLLTFEAVGDLAQIGRKKKALQDLERGRSQNPYLGQFLFDASQARESREIFQIQPQNLLLENINPSQKAAVETVLSAPDLALIQGPPGTGKTTVIAEICYQVALRGGRTLIASQANLAVDNALSRLQHNPAIRAIRKGNKNSVGVEGEPFLEENVIRNWLQNTSTDCEQLLNAKLNKQKVLNRLTNNREKIELYISEESRIQSKCKRLKQCQEKIQLDSPDLLCEISSSFSKLKSLCPSLDHLGSLEEDYQLVYSTIERCISELQDWSLKSYQDIKKYLTNCFEHRQQLQTEIINFPNFDFTNDFDFLSQQTKANISQPEHVIWEKGVNDYVSKINEKIKDIKIWDRAYIISNELDQATYQILSNLTTNLIDTKTLEEEKKKFLKEEYRNSIKKPNLSIETFLELCLIGLGDKITGVNYKRSQQANAYYTVEHLKQIVEQETCYIKQKQNVISKFLEWLQDFGYKFNLLSQPSKRNISIGRLKVINSLCTEIIRSSQPIDASFAAESATNELINIVLDSTKTWLLETKELFKKSQNIEEENQKINKKLQELHENIEEQRAWWKTFYQNLSNDFQLKISQNDLFSLVFLNSFKSHLNIWLKKLDEINTYLDRYQNLISDWIEGLKNPSEQNRHELKRIYLDNANVIGITCSQSAKGDFSKEFESFDIVIIDEVSKCTPPELLIPALKAKKLVLVGDHRQLPPMLNNDTIEEIAEELGATTEELNYLKESLFKNLFESAPESIKKMLTIQYRMHPQIMAGINQFYENNLECGLTNPNEQRTHHLANSNIQNNNHIVWIQTPLNLEFREQQETSVINEKEIEVIEKICQQFEQTWSVRVNQGQPRKEIGIITFYGRQLKLIESRIDPRNFPSLHIRTGTVDRFQGMERQVIIVSMVRNNNQKKIGFAEKSERANVAFSRAQELLVIVGCHSLFTQFPIYSKVAHIVNLHGGLIDVSDIL